MMINYMCFLSRGQPGAKTDKPYKGNKNTKGESKDPKKPFPERHSQNERRQDSKPVAGNLYL